MRPHNLTEDIPKRSALRFILGAVFWAVLIFIPLLSYSSHTTETLVFYDGDLIRAEGDYRVYLLSPGKRRWIRTIEVFDSYKFKWEDVRVVPPMVLTVFEFTSLIRQQGDEKVYLVNESGFKRHIPSPQVFASYGFDWNDVALVPSVEVRSYPESRLIRKEGDPKVYLIANNTKRWVESAEAFNSQGFNWDEVQTVNTTDVSFFQQGETITRKTPQVPPSVEEAQIGPREQTPEPVSATTTEPVAATTTEPMAQTVPETIAEVTIPTPAGGGGGDPNPASDTTAPSAITDFSVSTTSTSTMTLTWTTPGDDGSIGTAASYDIRHSRENITDANWSSAVQVSGESSPGISGVSDTATIGVFDADTTYYFAIKTTDEAGNESALSNIAIGATDALPPPPATTAPGSISNLSVSGVATFSVTLTWAAPGDDGSTGTATSYDARYSTSNITDANWSSATQATGEPTPQVAGSIESTTVSGLSAETFYYFAIKTSDEAGNESGLSNVSNSTTASCVTSDSGSQTYNVTSGSGQPQIQQIIVNPVDYSTGSSQAITVTARDTNDNDITTMEATFITDNGQSTISLSLISGSATSGSWSATWTPTDTRCGGYNIEVAATSASGSSQTTLSL